MFRLGDLGSTEEKGVLVTMPVGANRKYIATLPKWHFAIIMALALASCVGPTGNNLRNFGGIEETENYSARLAYFSGMSTQSLCQLAIAAESMPYVDRERLGELLGNSPFIYLDGVVLPLASSSDQRTGYGHGATTNAGIAMITLGERYRQLRTQVCPASADYVAGSFGRPSTGSRPDCLNQANAITPDQMCLGTFEGRRFSVALLDAAIFRAEVERGQREEESLRRRYAPIISCISSESFGTIRTTCR